MPDIQKRPACPAWLNLNSHYINNNTLKEIEKQEELSFYFYQHDKKREEEAEKYYFLYLQEQQIIYQNKDKEIDINKMLFVKPKPLKFVFTGFRESTVGIFAGTGGSGKSYMSLAFLLSYADVSCRLNYLNMFENKQERRGKCGYISLEDDEELIHHRLYNLSKYFNIKKNNELIDNIEIKCLYGQNFKLAEKNLNKIVINEEAEKKLYDFCKDKKFVVIDTLRRLSNLNENDSSEMSYILRTIEKISFQTGCAIIINSHVSKAEQDGKNKVRGASSITDDTRFTMSLKLVNLSEAEAKRKQKPKQLCLFYDKVNAIMIPENLELTWKNWIDEENNEEYSMIEEDNSENANKYYNIKSVNEKKEQKQETVKKMGRPRKAVKNDDNENEEDFFDDENED